jgi:hypothetical protein
MVKREESTNAEISNFLLSTAYALIGPGERIDN